MATTRHNILATGSGRELRIPPLMLPLPKSRFGPLTEGIIANTGKHITAHEGFGSIDTSRAKALIQASFGKILIGGYFSREPRAVLLAPGEATGAPYKGIAIIKSVFDEVAHLDIPYLDKLAVAPASKGNGIGRALMECVTASYMPLIWRSDRENTPANTLYGHVVEGNNNAGLMMPNNSKWIIFYHNMGFEQALRLAPIVGAMPETLLVR